MFYIVNILKAVACLLIANFHSDITFPDQLRLLAFGGDLGNNLFFLISGFTIWPSVSRTVPGEELQWYKNRFLRIAPMVGAFYVAEWAAGNIVIRSFRDAFYCFVFPTIYWFTGAILIMYAVFYVVEKHMTSGALRGGIAAALIVLHLIFDTIAAERYYIGFLAMMTGCELRREQDRVACGKRNAGYLVYAAVAFIVFCVLKLLRARGVEFLGLVHLSIGLLTVLIGTLLLVWGIRNDCFLADYFMKHSLLWNCIQTISNITMAVYLTMGFGDRVLMKAFIEFLPFPLSYGIGLVVYLGIAYGITQLDQILQKKVK